MSKVNFFSKDGKIHFEIPSDKALESKVRASIKTQSALPGKAEYFFKRGVLDAVKAASQGTSRKYGKPIVEVTNPFSNKTETMTCQQAYDLLHNIGGVYQIRQISGSPLPKNYWEERER